MTEKSCDICDSDSCAAKERRQDETDDAFLERQALARRTRQIGHKVPIDAREVQASDAGRPTHSDTC